MRLPPRCTEPSRTYRTFNSRPICFTSTALPLKANAVLRPITNEPEMRDRSVVRLSVTPSTKYSCSGSPPRLAKGRTTIERRGGVEADGDFTCAGLPTSTEYTRHQRVRLYHFSVCARGA